MGRGPENWFNSADTVRFKKAAGRRLGPAAWGRGDASRWSCPFNSALGGVWLLLKGNNVCSWLLQGFFFGLDENRESDFEVAFRKLLTLLTTRSKSAL